MCEGVGDCLPGNEPARPAGSFGVFDAATHSDGYANSSFPFDAYVLLIKAAI